MPPVTVPPEIVGDVARLPELLVSLEVSKGRSRSEAQHLVSLLPEAILAAPCFFDKLNSVWLYIFGDQFETARGGAAGTGITLHSVSRLGDILACARDRLPGPALDDYMRRIGDPGKHADLLYEFAPILRLDSKTDVEYEVAGESPGNRRVDWRISGDGCPTVLLEVKNRVSDLLDLFGRLQAGERGPEGQAPAPTHDTDTFFRSVETKFLPRSPQDRLQGVWVGSGLLQDQGDLLRSFRKLDSRRVHFAIVGTWDETVHLMSRRRVPRAALLRLLRVCIADDRVFDRASPG